MKESVLFFWHITVLMRFLLSFLLFFLFSVTSFAKPAERVGWQKKLDQLIDAWDGKLNMGVIVQSADTGQVLYKKNPDRFFLPASNLKLFTAWAALQYLGPEFTYQTQLFADLQKIQGGILQDSIYLKFSGDPVLQFEQIEHMIQSLSKAGVRQIQGDVIIDDTVFDTVAMSPGTVWDDQDFCFGAPIMGLMLERNCVEATLKPAATAGQPAQISFPAYPQFIHFDNKATTVDRETKSECKVEAKAAPAPASGYLVEGCMKVGDPEQKVEMAVRYPRIYFQTVLSHLFQTYQITHAGQIRFQKLGPLSGQPFAVVHSPTLSKLLIRMLKESDNVIANALFKTMGGLYAKTSGSFENGSAAVKEILSEKSELPLPKAKLTDGSGLSRYNYVTPKHVMALLKKAYQSPHFDLFFTALPVSGRDGTLKGRLQDAVVLNKIQAKTGTLGGVTALSGYLETRKKQTFIFTILINGFVEDPVVYKTLEDKICGILTESV